MKALVVDDFKTVPQWKEIYQPPAGPGEVWVQVRAAALSNLVKAKANGSHYSSRAEFPFVRGTDGVGTLPDVSRVFFSLPVFPYGSMGEYALVKVENCIALPSDISDVDAAALANPLMSSMAALTKRARFVKGESVLINGATGSSGSLAVKIAKILGASTVVVTGRNPEALRELLKNGADQAISLMQDPAALSMEVRQVMKAHQITVVLDYLFGPSAEAILNAIGGPGSAHSSLPVRYVQIGSISGATISLNASCLRSTALELMGSGLGSVSEEGLLEVIGKGLSMAGAHGLRVAAESVAMSLGAQRWNSDDSKTRIVFEI